MTPVEYLEHLLESQQLADDSDEIKELREHRDDVEELLLGKFSASKPTIRYGGSKAKGTLIKESYDLDLVFYVPNGEDGAGETLKEIFENVRKALADSYYTDSNTSAIRLKSKSETWIDFHIDVVPGRYTDDKKSDCFLYQNGADKERLKTNLDTHIAHIRDAGVTKALCILKLWRVRKSLLLKNFIWELLCIKLLDSKKNKPLDEQVKHVLTEVTNAEEAISVKDPANPEGNDLMPFLKSMWPQVRSAAQATLDTIKHSGWEAVFGKVDESASKAKKVDRLAAAVQATAGPTKPWRG